MHASSDTSTWAKEAETNFMLWQHRRSIKRNTTRSGLMPIFNISFSSLYKSPRRFSLPVYLPVLCCIIACLYKRSPTPPLKAVRSGCCYLFMDMYCNATWLYFKALFTFIPVEQTLMWVQLETSLEPNNDYKAALTTYLKPACYIQHMGLSSTHQNCTARRGEKEEIYTVSNI